MDRIINPSCLSVDNAVIILMSFAYIAAVPAIKECDVPMMCLVLFVWLMKIVLVM